MSERIAMVAALEAEVVPLVGRWKRLTWEVGGRAVTVFEHDHAMLLCGGIGAAAARRAADALVQRIAPAAFLSLGLAGALQPHGRVGDVIWPAEVVDAASGTRFRTTGGTGVVVSSPVIVGANEKQTMAQRFPGALAVDMEGAAVAEVAQRKGLPFVAVKAVSDELNFAMPPLGRFVDEYGRVNSMGVVAFAAVRPWLWPVFVRLARNTGLAARRLSSAVQPLLEGNALKNLKLTAESRVY